MREKEIERKEGERHPQKQREGGGGRRRDSLFFFLLLPLFILTYEF